MIMGGRDPQEVVAMIANVVPHLVGAMGRINEIVNSSGLQPDQQKYVKEYAWQMIIGNDKPEFALAVAADMILFYQQEIDQRIREQVPHGHPNIPDRPEMLNFGIAMDSIEESAIATNGGNYGFIAEYKGQQRGDSTAPGAMRMQYHLLTQRQDGDEQGKYYCGKDQLLYCEEFF
ncbi:MAG: hypothetical protein LBR92_00480 [Puniceicoccales bacterium]|jgi:hypothetical protein|nr:hypothetical protein [Puniceicoccales bacterium]